MGAMRQIDRKATGFLCLDGGPRMPGRRRFIHGLGAAAGLVAAPAILGGLRAKAGSGKGSLFTLGVASGDPDHHSVVLWTRLAPDPLNGGGMKKTPVQVRWEVAKDPGMRRVVRHGVAIAHPRNGHAVTVVASGLPSDEWLYYRFHAMGEASRVGRTRTFPHSRDHVRRMRCAVVSCQSFVQGYYPAYRDLAKQDLDFVVHTGDYIYESGASGNPLAPDRNHIGGEIFSVDDYRNRYALYRLDAHLQEAHARFPFLVTWDDHEVDNNYAGTIAEEGAPFSGADFVQRRENAYQVYAETMPLRSDSHHHGRGLQIYRKLEFGNLASIFMLDTRQYRSDQPAEDGFGSTDPDSANPLLQGAFGEVLFDADGIDDPKATLLGFQQEAWLAHGLKQSRAKWNVLAQQIMVTEWNLRLSARLTIEFNPQIPADQKAVLLQAVDAVDNFLNVDAWDGYRGARARLFKMLDKLRPSNPVMLTGDIHSAWGANLLADFQDPGSDALAAEFVCTSISSTFSGQDPRPTDAVVRPGVAADNKHIEFFNGLFRGYCLCDVTEKRWQTTYRAVGTLADVANPSPLALTPLETSTVETDAVLEIEYGFNAPNSGKRLETKFSRVPLA
jgi:alkaline phosphatase D